MKNDSFTILKYSVLFTLFSVGALWQSNLEAQIPELLYYQFDGVGASVPDYASAPFGNNPATIMGGLTQGGTDGCNNTAGLIGASLTSTTNHVATGASASALGTGDWTISFAINNTAPDPDLMYVFGTTSGSFRVFANGFAGADGLAMRGLPFDVIAAGAAAAGLHVTHFVHDDAANEVRAYVDGVLVNTVAGAVDLSGAGPIIVGGHNGSPGLPTGWVMDEVRIYNRALDQTEITATWNVCPLGGDDCAMATPLPVDAAAMCVNQSMGSNLTATPSGELPAPSCGNFNTGEDTWYSLTVPVNGEVNIEMSSAGGPTDWAMSAYSGACGALAEIECDDDDGPGLFPVLNLVGQTPGATIYVRVWEWGNNEQGSFNICAFSPPACDVMITGVASTDESCPGDSDGTITVTATTSSLGPLTYNLTGAAVQSNATGIFTGLPAGVYNVQVIDNGVPPPLCEDTAGPITIASDVIFPTLICPANTAVDCNNIPPAATTAAELAAQGGLATDNCVLVSVSASDAVVGDVCPNSPQRVITRTYSATDDSGNTSMCNYLITVQNSTVGPVITSVPPNHTINCSYNAMPQLPLFDADSDCGLSIALSVSGGTTNGTPNCPGSSIQYTYTAIDGCGRVAQHIQTYTIQNDGPEFVCPSELCIIECPENTDDIQTQFDDYAALATVNTSCNGSISISNNFNPNGFFNQNCNANPINGVENVRRWQVVTFTATDQCNRTTSCTAMVIIVDNTPPVISGSANDAIRYCDAIANDQYNKWINETINGTATTGGPTLTASDACGTWSWSYSPSSPNTNCTGNPFTITEVTFTATDQCGNASSVTALFKLKEQPTANVSGGVYTEESEEVEHVEVSINQAGVGPMGSYMTGADGQFGFEVGIFGDYEVIPYRNDEPLNGVSTLDLIYISMHILGIDELDSPYQLIAADANNSGNITSADLVAIRKLILFMVDEFENNTSWRFVDEDFVFPDPTNPFATTFPELRNINSLTLTQLADFIAVKIGDVSGDAAANQLAGTTGDTRSDQLTFNVTDQLLSAGERYTVDFKASDFTNVRGYQFSLNFDQSQLDFVDFIPGELAGLTQENFGFALLEEGVITSSWDTRAGVTIEDDAVLFSLVFDAKAGADLSDAIQFSSDYTKAEAYDTALNPMELDLNFETGKVDAHPFALYQNQPNPFQNETVIGFNLLEAGEATLTIFDVAGRIIHQVKGAYASGYNQVNISKANISQSGVMYYTLETAANTATKKMILIANH